MKKLFLLSFLLSSFSLMSQDYASMLSDSSAWIYMMRNSDSGNISYNFHQKYNIGNDTILNGINYKNIYGYLDNEAMGGMREDSLGKVFYKSFQTNGGLDTLDEFLAYDNSLVKGDVFTIKSRDSGSNEYTDLELYVVNLDTVEMENGEERRRWEITKDTMGIFGYTHYFIEGVGSDIDLLYFFEAREYNGWHISTFLVCHYIGQEVNYPNPNRASWTVCFLDPATSVNIPKVEKLQIFPNPVFSFLEIKGLGNISQNTQVEVFDLNGAQVFQSNFLQEEIDVSNFPKGIYFLLVKNEDQVWLEKFVKM